MDDTLRQMLNIGKEHYLRGDYAPARENLEKVIEKSQSFADVYNMLGVIYHGAGLFSKAQDAFEHAIKINPAYTEAALNLAVLYNDLGKYDQAKRVYEDAIKASEVGAGQLDQFVAGKIANMHADVADAYLSAGQIEPAIEEYRKAVGLRPVFADLRTKLAAALREARLIPEAIEELQQAISDKPYFLPARIQLGVCYYSMQEREKAIHAWNEVLEKDPKNTQAITYLKLIGAGPEE
ncbi:tetratricopeptide repeat protein [Myxococcota bacterium]|nr:tetratricopeptide repeat protein [Myxococcota bacterium]